VPEDLADMMSDLHPAALRVLSGPERAFAGVWATLGGAQAPVRLRFLGGAEAWLRGESVPLPRRLAEITLALVLHPDGITMEALHAFLVGDLEEGPVVATLYAHIRRLRALLPVSGPPYRLSEAFDADLLRLWSHLERSQVRDAVALYQGALLPGSGAPGVREHGALLEEQLRQAAMAAGDPDALFQLADGVADDLELWEATEAALAPGDPRLALARARIRRLGEEYGATTPAGDRGPGAWSPR